MRKYDWVKGEYVEEEVLCNSCGNAIASTVGYRVSYEENERGERVQVITGGCCAGRITAYRTLSKQVRQAYQSRGQIQESVLKRMPKSPPPNSSSNNDAGRQAHQFIDTVGRSKLAKSTAAKIKYSKAKKNG